MNGYLEFADFYLYSIRLVVLAEEDRLPNTFSLRMHNFHLIYSFSATQPPDTLPRYTDTSQHHQAS